MTTATTTPRPIVRRQDRPVPPVRIAVRTGVRAGGRYLNHAQPVLRLRVSVG